MQTELHSNLEFRSMNIYDLVKSYEKENLNVTLDLQFFCLDTFNDGSYNGVLISLDNLSFCGSPEDLEKKRMNIVECFKTMHIFDRSISRIVINNNKGLFDSCVYIEIFFIVDYFGVN